MADVFISYASEDRVRAFKLANVFKDCGWSVWWDGHIKVGQAFDKVIEHELETAKSVVVLWSKESVASEWVKNEAAVAVQRGVMVPALIDSVRLPLEFMRKQTADLVGWEGDSSHPGIQALCNTLATMVSDAGALPHRSTGQPSPRARGSRLSVLSLIPVVIFMFVVGVYYGSDDSVPLIPKREASVPVDNHAPQASKKDADRRINGDMEAAPRAPIITPSSQDPATTEAGTGSMIAALGLAVYASPLAQQQEYARAFGTEGVPGGLVVSGVEAGSDAAVRGLRSGDVILSVQSGWVDTPRDLEREVEVARAIKDQDLRLEVLRGATVQTVIVRISSM